MPTGQMQPKALSILVWLAFLAGATSASHAQALGRVEGRQTGGAAGYYINALPNEPTIRVSVRGDVPRTGVYDLGSGFDLPALVALAGGPMAADLDPRDPEVLVRLFREGERERVYEASYQAFVGGDLPAPALRDGDVVEIETRYERGVYVWGAVRTPGFFQVGPGVDAVRLLALAGGPQIGGAQDSGVIQDATVSIIRSGQGTVFESTLEAFVAGTAVPPLQDGDALQVDIVRRSRFTFRDGLSVVGSVAALALVILRIADATGGSGG